MNPDVVNIKNFVLHPYLLLKVLLFSSSECGCLILFQLWITGQVIDEGALKTPPALQELDAVPLGHWLHENAKGLPFPDGTLPPTGPPYPSSSRCLAL
jgi:hypothetical protein